MSRGAHLSKSRYTAGLQCHRALWWRVHDPEAPELVSGPELQAIFDRGARVGELAREYLPGGELIHSPCEEVERSIEATRAAIAAGARIIYEASFRADDVFVAVDILHRPPRSRGWTLSEVKSTTKVKPHHIPGAAVQTHVLRRAGLPVTRTEVMHLERECRHPALYNLFTRTDVSEEVEEYLPAVPREVRAQLRMLGRASPPEVRPGAHCTAPYVCPFLARCWGEEEEVVQKEAVIVDERLRDVLAGLEGPIAHLDFETVNPAVPVWPGCRPYDPVPVQFSVHFEPVGEGAPRHFEWLASGAGDPRTALARALVRALRGARTVIVYHQPFEQGRLRDLQEAVPDLAGELEDIIARLVDLLPIVRRHVVHPGFGGRYSLKKVAPALVPGLRYEEMEIGDGAAASRALETLLLGPEVSAGERRRTREALLAYCGQDTLATMGVLSWLRRAVGSRGMRTARRAGRGA